MRAVIMRDKQLVVDEFPNPNPGPGEVLVKVNACGICGSDLHALKHAEAFVEQSNRGGGVSFDMDLNRDVVMGHEYCGEIVDYGADCQASLKVGARVCSIPGLLRDQKLHTIGYSNDHPGGYGEYMRLTESLLLAVPNGLSANHAALTEPMAVGLHAVNKARIDKGDVPMVIGCGPVGLAVIAALKTVDARPIIAADFSPGRRKLAELMGADTVVDPAETSPYASWLEAASIGTEEPQGPPRLITGMRTRPAVIFECVGIPGVINEIMENAPRAARIVVVGVCMQHDHFYPVYGINKELNIQFVVAYSRREFADTLTKIAEGEIDVAPLITGRVGLDGVAGAFDVLSSPDRHAKILVDPTRSGTSIAT